MTDYAAFKSSSEVCVYKSGRGNYDNMWCVLKWYRSDKSRMVCENFCFYLSFVFIDLILFHLKEKQANYYYSAVDVAFVLGASILLLILPKLRKSRVV